MWRFLNEHKGDVRIWMLALLLHTVYFSLWLSASESGRNEIERNSVTVAMVSSIMFYTVVIIAFWKAQKTRLNKALALNKTYWDLLIAGIGLPAHTGWYDPMPQIYRSYIWLGVATTIFWVLYELWMINRGYREGYPWIGERRTRRRREADRIQDQIVARYIERYGQLEDAT